MAVILATGATGVVGHRIVLAAAARGAAVRAFVRDARKARDLLGDAAEPVLGDLDDEAAVERALRGADTLLLSTPDRPDKAELEARIVDAAAAAGVERVVKLSTVGAAPDSPAPFWAAHGRAEQHLRRSGLAATVVRSSFFMSNLLASAESVRAQGLLVAPAGSARIAMIDPRDVGEAVAAVLADGGRDGETLTVTGPEAIDFAAAARAIAAATGTEVRFVDAGDDDARRAFAAGGAPPWFADAVVAAFRELRAGAAATVTRTFADLTGRAPRGVAEFARDHAAAFAGRAVPVG